MSNDSIFVHDPDRIKMQIYYIVTGNIVICWILCQSQRKKRNQQELVELQEKKKYRRLIFYDVRY